MKYEIFLDPKGIATSLPIFNPNNTQACETQTNLYLFANTHLADYLNKFLTYSPGSWWIFENVDAFYLCQLQRCFGIKSLPAYGFAVVSLFGF